MILVFNTAVLACRPTRLHSAMTPMSPSFTPHTPHLLCSTTSIRFPRVHHDYCPGRQHHRQQQPCRGLRQLHHHHRPDGRPHRLPHSLHVAPPCAHARAQGDPCRFCGVADPLQVGAALSGAQSVSSNAPFFKPTDSRMICQKSTNYNCSNFSRRSQLATTSTIFNRYSSADAPNSNTTHQDKSTHTRRGWWRQ